MECTWHKFVTDTGKICYLSYRGKANNAHYHLRSPPKRVRARHSSNESDLYRQTLNVMSFAARSEGKDRVASVVGRARARGCLGTRSATSDGAAVYNLPRARVPRLFCRRVYYIPIIKTLPFSSGEYGNADFRLQTRSPPIVSGLELRSQSWNPIPHEKIYSILGACM